MTMDFPSLSQKAFKLKSLFSLLFYLKINDSEGLKASELWSKSFVEQKAFKFTLGFH
jgi:hypothetical protein